MQHSELQGGGFRSKIENVTYIALLWYNGYLGQGLPCSHKDYQHGGQGGLQEGVQDDPLRELEETNIHVFLKVIDPYNSAINKAFCMKFSGRFFGSPPNMVILLL